MAAQPFRPRDDDPYVPADLGSLQPCEYLGPESACPPEYVGVPIQELIAQIEAERRERAVAADQESLPAGFQSRNVPAPAPVSNRAAYSTFPPPTECWPD